jgi:hypothetical protein
MPQATRYGKRPAIGSSSRQRVGRNVPVNQGGQRPICSKCGKMHAGECRSGTGTCFRCGRAYHFVKDCPMAGIGGLGCKEVAINRRLHRIGFMHSPQAKLIMRQVWNERCKRCNNFVKDVACYL